MIGRSDDDGVDFFVVELLLIVASGWNGLADQFARQRKANVKWLRTLRPAQLKRKSHHQVVGEITAGEMIHEWAFHDLGHLEQILEVKRYWLWPNMGSMQQFYKLQ